MSRLAALKAFLEDLPAVVKRIKELSLSAPPQGEEKVKFSRWLRQIGNYKFPSMCVTQLDIDNVLTAASKKTQSDRALSIDVPAIKAEIK